MEQNDKCLTLFEKKKRFKLVCLNHFVYSTYSESISDLLPAISRNIPFDHAVDHDRCQSIFTLSICGEPYDLLHCSRCNKLLFVAAANTENKK
jgi:hypothetical protein